MTATTRWRPALDDSNTYRKTTMASASLNLHEIENAQEYLMFAEYSLELDPELGDDDLPPLRDEDVPDALWLGAVALFVSEEGFDGNSIVARNQDQILTARAAGFTVREIADYAVLKERKPLR